VVHARRDHARHRGYQPRVVLVVGMEHHDDIGAVPEEFSIARFPVCAVPEIAGVGVHIEAELPGGVDSPIGAGVIDEEDVVGDPGRDVLEGPGEGRLGIVSRQDDDHLLPEEHAITSLTGVTKSPAAEGVNYGCQWYTTILPPSGSG